MANPIPKPPLNGSINIDYTKFNLPNGIKCILYPRKEIHSVTVRVNVNVGSLDEDEKTNGLAHFLEHVVHDGTEKLPTWDAIDNFTNEYSGTTNAFTTAEITQYYGTFPFQYIDQAVFYFSQLVFNPLIKESDLNKERNIILDELSRGEDEVDHQIMKQVRNTRFKSINNPFAFDIIGTKELIENYTIKEMQDFYKKHYVPENIEIYIVGNMDLKKTKDILVKYFYNEIKKKDFTSKPERKFKTVFPDYSDFSINAKQKLDLNQYYLTVTFPGYEFKSTVLEKRILKSFVQTVTASSNYFQSILWKRLREELQIVYGVGTWSYDLYSRSILAIQTSFDKKHLETVLKEIWQGVNKIKSNEIDDSVFKARKKRIVDTQLMQLDRPDNILNWISEYEDELEQHGSGMLIKEYLDYINNLTFNDVVNSAKELYNWDKVNIGIISKDDTKEVEEEVKLIWKSISQLKLI